MERIEKEAMRMGVLVEDLLALARLDERRDVVITAVDLRPIARDAALDVRATAPQRRVTVHRHDAPSTRRPHRGAAADAPPADEHAAHGADLGDRARPGRPSRCCAASPSPAARAPRRASVRPVDPVHRLAWRGRTGRRRRLRSCSATRTASARSSTNLLGNARRFTAEDSPIELRVGVDTWTGAWGGSRSSTTARASPTRSRTRSSSGSGAPTRPATRETGGTGLGLSIVASIVEALHGSVAVADTPGGGATFRVAFPLAEPRDAAEHLHLETQPLRRLHRVRRASGSSPAGLRVARCHRNGRRLGMPRPAAPSVVASGHLERRSPMAVFSVDSDAVLSSTAAVRGTIDRLQAESNAMLAQLTQLQASWTGAASAAFQGVVEQWRATQRTVEECLAGINAALSLAGRQYADAEQASMSLFR